MIVIRVELWPGGDEDRATHLGTAVIANDGTGTRYIGNYNVFLGKWGEEDPMRLVKVKSARWKTGRVEGFQRLIRGPWDLMGSALSSMLGRRLKTKEET